MSEDYGFEDLLERAERQDAAQRDRDAFTRSVCGRVADAAQRKLLLGRVDTELSTAGTPPIDDVEGRYTTCKVRKKHYVSDTVSRLAMRASHSSSGH